MAGVSVALKARSPGARFVGVEPAGFDDIKQSLKAGKRVTVTPEARSLCDALESPSPGSLTFPILRANLAGVALVTDAEVAQAMRYAFETLKLVVEPGGVVGLAALLAGRIKPGPRETVGLILSGGNVDPELFARIIKGEI
jgi:threonine dehydratase